MASHTLAFLAFPLLLVSISAGAFLLPLVKDSARQQYTTSFQIGTPPVRIYLSVDLGNPTNWLFGTAAGYNQSSSYKPLIADSPKCIAYCGAGGSRSCYDTPSPLCNINQCAGWATNPRRLNYSYHSDDYAADHVVEDVLSPLYPRDPSHSKATLLRFPFIDITTTGPLKDLSHYSKGILTLARNPMAIHSQISSDFKIPHKFAICLPSSSSPSQFSGVNGAVYFGGGPYILPPGKVDLSAQMVSTKLINNTFQFADEEMEPGNYPPGDCYFKINSIQIDGAPVKFNSKLMSIDRKGNGGAKLSTMAPYTMLHSEIYKAFLGVFLIKAKALNMTIVKPIRNFKTCFSTDSIWYNARTGSGIPVIGIVMDGNQSWKLYGSNSMVKVSKTVKCLAIFDGGVKSSGGVFPSVVIGGKQMEDSLVEFDLVASKLRVASSLQRFGTSCSQFKGI